MKKIFGTCVLGLCLLGGYATASANWVLVGHIMNERITEIAITEHLTAKECLEAGRKQAQQVKRIWNKGNSRAEITDGNYVTVHYDNGKRVTTYFFTCERES